MNLCVDTAIAPRSHVPLGWWRSAFGGGLSSRLPRWQTFDGRRSRLTPSWVVRNDREVVATFGNEVLPPSAEPAPDVGHRLQIDDELERRAAVLTNHDVASTCGSWDTQKGS